MPNTNDFELIAVQVHSRALTAIGYPISQTEIADRFTGIQDDDMYAVIERELGRPLPADHDAKVKADILAAYPDELAAIDGARSAVENVSAKVCVASNSHPEKLELGLRVTGLYDLFAPNIFDAEMVKRGKPAPDLFLHAASQMGVAAQDCIVVEDSVAGITAALAAHMPVIGFCGAGHCGFGYAEMLYDAGAAVVIEELHQLSDAIAELK